MPLRLTSWICFLFISFSVFGQNQDKNKPTATSDTLKKAAPIQSPKKAALLSLLPGAGQFYNKKYWKIPVIYAAMGGLGYLAHYNYGQFQFYKGSETQWIGKNPGQESSPEFVNIQTNKSDFQHVFDLDLIIMAGVYLLNIVDAAVDAHLYTYDVSKDLSLQFKPDLLYCRSMNAPQAGLQLTLKF
jgi:hypothetical protein